ncbi:MAG: transporter substrate-binding domain-containing protein, partial [Gemmatimonadetes bacterium]|nr:transporter substrate-binding domain-containing protein [Gemmatimonadota bacterium]
FSRPTFLAPTALLVRREDAGRVAGFADVRDRPGGEVAVLEGAYEEGLARAAGIPADRILRVPDPATGVAAVRAGRAVGFALSLLTLRRLVSGSAAGDLAVVSPLRDSFPPGVDPVGRGAFGFRHEDEELRRAFDGVLGSLVGTPEHLALVQGVGFVAADLPRPEVPARAR